MSIKILPEVSAIKAEIIANRRNFHKYPELGFNEHLTGKLIAEKLSSYGIDVRTGIGKTGIIGDLRGKEKGKTVALRADMDALAVQEKTGQPGGAVHTADQYPGGKRIECAGMPGLFCTGYFF